MKVAHVLRKYVPREWGGTESAVKQLIDGLRHRGVDSVVFCPRLGGAVHEDPGPLGEGGHPVRRYRATLPILGLPTERRRQLESVGGNLLSVPLLTALWREPGVSVIHSHALNRIGGAALSVARLRKVPFVVTVHGGAMDLPRAALDELDPGGGIDWGKPYGALLRSRQVLPQADAILTVNAREAELLRERFPGRRILVTSHGIDLDRFGRDERARAPRFDGKPLVLIVGRIDPVKNQGWVIGRWAEILRRRPGAALVCAGPVTDPAYGAQLETQVRQNGLTGSVHFTGGFPPGDPALLGLLQGADLLILPSRSETFGVVIVEAWAAGTPVMASRTTGACQLIEDGASGLLFDLDEPDRFADHVDRILAGDGLAENLTKTGLKRAQDYGIEAASAPVRDLYEELCESRRR